MLVNVKTTTMCKRCGAPIAQQPGRGRPRQYCQQGDCQQAAKRQRELRRATPGLEGALARAEDLYERAEAGLAAAIAPLAEALSSELDPGRVEEKLAASATDADRRVAAARAERDEAVTRTQSVERELAELRQRLETAETDRDIASTSAASAAELTAQAQRERDTALSDRDTAVEEAEASQQAAQIALSEAQAAVESAEVAEVRRREAQAHAAEAEQAALAAERETATRTVERDVSQRAAAEAERLRMEAVSGQAVAVAEAERLRAEVDAARQRTDDLTSQRDELNLEVAAAATRLSDVRSQVVRLREELASARTDADRQRERAVTAEATGRSRDETIARLSQELEQTRRVIEADEVERPVDESGGEDRLGQ